MYQTVGKKVKVLAAFEDGKIIPMKFKWSGRDHRIKKVNLFYEERSGRSINYYFSVETETGGVFKLRYNDENLSWTLEEYWVE